MSCMIIPPLPRLAETFAPMPLRFAAALIALLCPVISLHGAKAPKPPPASANPGAASPSHELAFPGAEGFGAFAQGGRGGRVLRVTTLEDNHQPGSLRWAIAQAGPRIIEFAVEGAISLKDSLTINQPFLTLDGSTAPGAGITIRDSNIKIVQTHNIIIRYLRVRPGDEAQLGKGAWRGNPRPIKSGDAVSVAESSDVIIDHVSASWATDETISVTHSRRVTVQHCFITEPLANPVLHVENGVQISHAFGALVGGENISYLKNYIACFRIRGPQMSGGKKELPSRTAAINNLVAFYEGSGTRVKAARESSEYVVQNNVYRHPLKPDAPDVHLLVERTEKGTENFITPEDATGRTRVFIAGNLGPMRPRADLDDWASVKHDFPAAAIGRLRVAQPPFRVEPLALLPASEVEDFVLTHAGATLPRRDAIDDRLIRQHRAGRGAIIQSQDDVGGYSPSDANLSLSGKP